MPEITIGLIRRKAEHNEGLIHSLEELSLHQEELESINETLGCNCRRLKILYLQNNIIGDMRNLHHMKELEYLNLALNNIPKVEGIQSCEFLNKLDLTLNFVDLDHLETSVTAMEGNHHLKDLYMMGNPCQSWAGFEAYVTARLPQLERLDGKDIKRTDRIRAQQQLPALREKLVPLAKEAQQRKLDEKLQATHSSVRAAVAGGIDGRAPLDSSSAATSLKEIEEEAIHEGEVECEVRTKSETRQQQQLPPAQGKHDGDGVDGNNRKAEPGKEGEELTKHTPEVRTAIYREMAEQKKEQDDKHKENLPKDRDFEREQEKAVARARERETEGIIRQCNEGKLDFRFEETRSALPSSLVKGDWGGRGATRGGGEIVLEVAVPRYLDSSLIDLDVHPHYVSIVIKGKVLRLSLQAEVKASEAKAKRSKTTGSLVVTMPKVNPHETLGLLPRSSGIDRRAPGVVADRATASKNAKANDEGRTKRRTSAAPPLATLMMEEAKAATAVAASSRSGKRPGEDENGDGCDGASTTTAGGIPRQAVSVRGIVGPRHGGIGVDVDAAPQLLEVASSTKRTGTDAMTQNAVTAKVEEHEQPYTAAPNATVQILPQSLPTPPVKPGDIGDASPGGSKEKNIVPPAPPSGNFVPVAGRVDEEKTGVVWPQEGTVVACPRDVGEATAFGSQTRLDELD